jgi:CheY-like chemotaxis protein
MNSENTLDILLVDDEPSVRKTVTGLLHLFGHRVWEAENGIQALEILAENRFDLIMTDIGMPHMDGLSFLNRIGEIPVNTPVIVVTGQQDLMVAQRALEAGAEAFMTKPISLDDLKTALQEVMQRCAP